MKAFHQSGTRKKGSLFLTGSFILSLFCFLFPSPAHSGEPVKIGLLTSSPESSFEVRKPYLRGAEMAVAEVNASEGKQGLQLLLVIRDMHQTREKDLNHLRDLILEERLPVLVGGVRNEDVSPIAKLARQQRVPFLVFPNEFMEAASTGGEPANLFWISPAPEAFQRAAVRTAVQFSKNRFYLLARDSIIGRSWAKYFWEELKKLKPEATPVGEFFLSGKTDDYSLRIQEILSTQAEVCLSYLGANEWVRFARIAKKQGYFKKIIHFELESGSLESLMALKKDAPEGVWGVSAFPFWALGWKETREFVTGYKERNQTFPGLDALSGYVSIYALVGAIRKAGSLDPEKITGALEGLSFQTPVGPLAIRKADHRALWPIWCGSSKFTSGYPFAVLGDLKSFGPDSFSPDQAR